jgi:hypothetical protein
MATSLLDWIMNLLQDPEAREHFQANPQAAMASAGMSSVCGQDVRDARAFLLDNPNVHQVGGGDTQDVRGDAGHDHIHHIINNYAYEPKHPVTDRVDHVAPVSGIEHLSHAGHYGRIEHLRADGTGNNHDHPVATHHRVTHPLGRRIDDRHDHNSDDSHDHRLADRHDRYAHVDDAHNRWAHIDDSHDRHNHTWHEFGVGPTASGGTGSDQHDSRVAHDQLEMGGRGNLLGDDNDFSDRGQHNQTRTDTNTDTRTASRVTNTSTSSDSHRHDATVRGTGAAGHNIHADHTNTVDHTDTTVNGNGASGRDLHADHTNSHTNVSGNGSAGHDVHVDKNGPVMGQGMANGDIDHTGSLAGLDHTVSVGDINLLSGLVNTGDILDGSLDHSLNHVVDHSLNHSPILSGDTIPVLSPSLLSNDPILSGDLDRSPVLAGNLNNSLNHVLNGDLNHDLNGDLNHSLNHLGQGSLDDLLHNTDVHNIHDILENIHVIG